MRLRFRGLVPPAAPPPAGEPPRLSADPHRLSVDTLALDRLALDDEVDALAARGRFRLEVHGRDEAAAREIARELAARCRRWRFHTNAASRGPAFAAALLRHRAVHLDEGPRPAAPGGDAGERAALARADYRHALDVWQWVLALDRGASAAVQLAALFHDVERVISPTDRRRAEAAADYAAAKRSHAEASARAAAALLAATPVDPSTARRAADLIAAHDAPAAPAGRAGDLAFLEEADALSFLVLNSHGYRRFHGDARWRDKVCWTLARLGPRGRARLAALRLAPDLAAALPALLVAPAVAPGLLPSSGGAAASLRRSPPEPPREET